MPTNRITLIRCGVFCRSRDRGGCEGFLTLREARRLVRWVNRQELREPDGHWWRVDRRRGWIVVEPYPVGLN